MQTAESPPGVKAECVQCEGDLKLRELMNTFVTIQCWAINAYAFHAEMHGVHGGVGVRKYSCSRVMPKASVRANPGVHLPSRTERFGASMFLHVLSPAAQAYGKQEGYVHRNEGL